MRYLLMAVAISLADHFSVYCTSEKSGQVSFAKEQRPPPQAYRAKPNFKHMQILSNLEMGKPWHTAGSSRGCPLKAVNTTKIF
jgi:hypothetical protein